MADEKTFPDESTAEQALARDAVMRAAGISTSSDAEVIQQENSSGKEGTVSANQQGESSIEPQADPVDAPVVQEGVSNQQGYTETEQTEEDGEGGSMSLISHLTELRSRLIKSLLSVALGSCVAYFFLDDIMAFITAPAGKLYFMQPAEAFFTYIKVTIFAGFLLALPLVFYQIWRFFLPAMTRGERLVLGLIVPSSVALFLAGLAFSFTLVLPAAVKFFMGIGDENIAPMFSVEKYFDFMLAFILPFGAVFEVPLIIIILAKLGIVSSAFLQKQFRMLIFLSFVFGAIISPTPDIFTQSMIALPMIALYGVGLFIVKYIMRK